MKQEEIFANKFGITPQQAREALIYHARRWGGCVSCKHSLPSSTKLSWLVRSCPFGMRQESCTKFEKIEGENYGENYPGVESSVMDE